MPEIIDEAEEGLKYVPDGKYRVGSGRMAFLLKAVPDRADFENAYETMALKEVEELYGIHTDDVYILMNYYHVPYKQPKSTGDKAFHTRETHKVNKRDFSEFAEPKEPKAPRRSKVSAKSEATVANQQNVMVTMPEIDYDKLAEKIVYHMARRMLKGFINE